MFNLRVTYHSFTKLQVNSFSVFILQLRCLCLLSHNTGIVYQDEDILPLSLYYIYPHMETTRTAKNSFFSFILPVVLFCYFPNLTEQHNIEYSETLLVVTQYLPNKYEYVTLVFLGVSFKSDLECQLAYSLSACALNHV